MQRCSCGNWTSMRINKLICFEEFLDMGIMDNFNKSLAYRGALRVGVEVLLCRKFDERWMTVARMVSVKESFLSVHVRKQLKEKVFCPADQTPVTLELGPSMRTLKRLPY